MALMLAFDNRDRANAIERRPPPPEQSSVGLGPQAANPLWDHVTTRGPLFERRKDAAAAEPQPSVEGCDDNRKAFILEAAGEAKNLVDRALTALDRPRLLSFERSAFDRHFGAGAESHRSLITERYRHIKDNLDIKVFVCKRKCPEKKGHLCAQAAGSGNTIFICPAFGSAGCPPAITILHEAAHNAGATGEVDRDGAYPPANAEDNTYSYEHFAEDLLKGSPVIELRPKKEGGLKMSR
jgi:hypothetical protein